MTEQVHPSFSLVGEEDLDSMMGEEGGVILKE